MMKTADRKRLRSIWTDMHRRCNNPKRPDYKWYGARGISVCDEWIDFDAFAQWSVKNGYQPELTLDREKNDQNYSPENCRWVTILVQEQNRRDTDHITLNGVTKCLTEWGRHIGIGQQTLWRRLYRYGWTVEQTLSTPVGVRR